MDCTIMGIAIALAIFIVYYYRKSHQYWTRRNVPCLQPTHPFGVPLATILGTENWAITMTRYYNDMKKNGWKHGGFYFFTSPIYFPLDLNYLKNIFTKDFQFFTDRAMYYHEKKDSIYAHLVSVTGPKWRLMRPKLNPQFSSSKIKLAFPTLATCQNHLITKTDQETSKNQPIDIKELSSCFTTDVIGTCIFGLDCKSFEDDNSLFRVFGRKLFNPTPLQHFKRVFGINFPKVATWLNFSINQDDVNSFYLKVVEDTVTFRERNNFIRNDFMQLLIELKNSSDEAFSSKDVAAQCFGFFTAGFETSSTLMSFGLYELAKNPKIQERVHGEVINVLEEYDGKVCYDSIVGMKYLDQVIDETLRKYPPIPLLSRKCVKNYKVPDEDLVIEEGTMVMVPILGLHYDEEYYPNPEKFDPERFNEENKRLIPRFAYLPFGEGPRICIGKRFGLIQAKVGLSCLLRNFRFSVNSKTEEPLKMQPSGTTLSTVDKIWLDAVKL